MAETDFQPAWFSKPGDTLSSLLARKGASPSDLAQKMGKDIAYIRSVLAGYVPIDQSLANALEKFVGGSSAFWLERQSQFSDALDRVANNIEPESAREWLKMLPLRDMKNNGWIPDGRNSSENLRSALLFFGVVDPGDWQSKYTTFEKSHSFRTSPSFDQKLGALASWLRQAEILASSMDCKPWDRAGFKSSLDEMRVLTKAKDPAYFVPRIQNICARYGVAVVFLKAPSGCRASGATRFLSPSKAMMVLSFRHLSDDHFWFTFFHEAGHLVLHGDAETFVDGEVAGASEREAEANYFSACVLIPGEMNDALARIRGRTREIIRFALTVGVSPGIVVGQMQHRGFLGPHQMNSLKRHYTWDEILRAIS